MIRRALPFTVAAVLAYLGWVALARYAGDRRVASRPRVSVSAPIEEETTALRIAQFYASSGEVTRGGRVVLCYGVRNARAVRIDPDVETLKPAANRCFSATPAATTTYTLHAEGLDGTAAQASFTVRVVPPPPRILFVHLSSNDFKRGTKWTMCYGLTDAVRAVFEPMHRDLPVARKHCMQTFLVRSGNYALVAFGEDGRTDREQFAITVR